MRLKYRRPAGAQETWAGRPAGAQETWAGRPAGAQETWAGRPAGAQETWAPVDAYHVRARVSRVCKKNRPN